MDDQDFLAIADRLIETLDDFPDRTYRRASDFFDSVKEKTEEMAKRVRDGAPVTPAMLVAIENMEAGVNKWLR